MCGIAGFTQFHQHIGDQTTLETMEQAIFHRGPDAGNHYLDDNVGLAHRRLSIIDLSAAGTQPMHSHDGDYVIVFNGEIYNYQGLREALVAEGYPFQNQTDTEVILALYHKYQEKMLPMLNGMFAFALWDKKAKKLLIGRDRMGKKPLYYCPKGEDIVFASELKAILTLPDVPKDIRADAVYDFFAYQYVPDPKTIFTHMHKLPPGHYMWVDANGYQVEQYWDVSFAKQHQATEKQLGDQLYQLLDHCTRQRMVSDVPLGAFLSGGVDSSGVVAMMAKASPTPVKTCSIGFDEKAFNETEFAQAVADKYQTEHHEFMVHANVADNLEKIVAYFDEPFADPSLVPTYFVSQLARQQVTVAIAGDGGDEVFAGYEKYSIDATENKLRNLFPAVVRKQVFPPLARVLGKFSNTLCKKGRSLLTSLSVDPAMGFYMSNAQMDDATWQALAKPELKQALGDYHPSKITLDAYARADGPDHLSKILYTDMKTYLPGGILVKVDRMSMANSLEVRAPILDYQVVEFAAGLPSELKFHQGEKKYLLKETFKPLLPDDILYRKKMGFSVPLASWFRKEIHDLAAKYLLASDSGLHQYFNPEAIRTIWQQHQSGSHDHGAILWSMLMFELWWQHYIAPSAKVEG